MRFAARMSNGAMNNSPPSSHRAYRRRKSTSNAKSRKHLGKVSKGSKIEVEVFTPNFLHGAEKEKRRIKKKYRKKDGNNESFARLLGHRNFLFPYIHRPVHCRALVLLCDSKETRRRTN